MSSETDTKFEALVIAEYEFERATAAYTRAILKIVHARNDAADAIERDTSYSPDSDLVTKVLDAFDATDETNDTYERINEDALTASAYRVDVAFDRAAGLYADHQLQPSVDSAVRSRARRTARKRAQA